MRLVLLSCLLLPATAPLAAQVTRQQPLSTFRQQEARLLLRDRLPCLGCHELDGEGGRIGPPLTGVASRRGAAYVRAIIDDPQRVVHGGGMPLTRMPDATRELIIAYLTRDDRQPALPLMVPSRRQAGQVSVAEPASVLYGKWCASCHGRAGRGDGPNAGYLPVRPAVHADAVRMSRRSDDALFDAIAGGGAVMGMSVRMPSFGATLSAGEIRSLVAYIRALCACQGPPWSRDGGGGGR